MEPIHLLLPGELTDLTGGTLYDRRIAEGLSERGEQVRVHELDRSFPTPTDAALLQVDAVLSGLPEDALVVIDGLALGAMPRIAATHATRLRLIGLVHHPLALETGLDAVVATRLRDSEAEALQHVRRIIVTSASTAALLDGYGVPPERVRVVEPGTDPAPLARRDPDDLGPLRLLSVGGVTPRKGHLQLVEALGGLAGLRDAKHTGPRWQLDIAGALDRDPDTTARLRARISALGLDRRVRLLGELPRTEVARLYAEADLFVLASLFEGYGMAYAEALAHGLPILGTSGGAIGATVPATAGLLISPTPENTLVPRLRDALQRLLCDPQLRAELADGAARARAALPDWSSAAARFAGALADV
jgi:glycosyltransferase involved in cell wall biosynthesis